MPPLWKRATPPLSYLLNLYDETLRLLRWLASVLKDWRNCGDGYCALSRATRGI